MAELVVYLFILGYFLQHLGMILQILRILRLKSAESVSVDTLILFVFSTLARSYWMHDTILMESYFTYVEIICGLGATFYLCYLTLIKFNSENSPLDSLNNKLIPLVLRWYFMLIISAIASYFIFPGNEGQSFDIQMLVSFSIFTEATNLIPQIFFLKAKKDSHDISQVYNILMLCSRFLRLIFWLKLYFDNDSIEFLIFADILNLVMVGSYVYSTFKFKDGFSLPVGMEKSSNKVY